MTIPEDQESHCPREQLFRGELNVKFEQQGTVGKLLLVVNHSRMDIFVDILHSSAENCENNDTASQNDYRDPFLESPENFSGEKSHS